MLKAIAKLLKILNSEESPTAVAWGISLAFLFSMLPVFSLVKWCVLLVVALFRVNLSAFILFSALFPLLAWLLDPLFNQMGYWLLTQPSLESFWQTVMQTSFGSFFAANNTLALSTLICGVVLLLPIVYLGKKLIRLYREKVKSKVEKLHLVQAFKASRLYHLYQSLS